MKSIKKTEIESNTDLIDIELQDTSFKKRNNIEGYKERNIVRAIVEVEENKFVFVNIVRDDEFGKLEYIETSGGGVELNESLEEALKREMQEELGYKIEIIKYLGKIVDYYNLIDRKNINNYFLVRKTGDVNQSLTDDEKNLFHLKRVIMSLDEAKKEYAKHKNDKLGYLIYQREIVVVEKAKNFLIDTSC